MEFAWQGVCLPSASHVLPGTKDAKPKREKLRVDEQLPSRVMPGKKLRQAFVETPCHVLATSEVLPCRRPKMGTVKNSPFSMDNVDSIMIVLQAGDGRPKRASDRSLS